eukprot:628480-Pelagomonas_calceolata.AAC.2
MRVHIDTSHMDSPKTDPDRRVGIRRPQKAITTRAGKRCAGGEKGGRRGTDSAVCRGACPPCAYVPHATHACTCHVDCQKQLRDWEEKGGHEKGEDQALCIKDSSPGTRWNDCSQLQLLVALCVRVAMASAPVQ